MASVLPSPNPCCTGCGSTEIDVVVTTTAPVGWYVVDTIAELRALTNRSTNAFAQVNGGAVFDDGLGGTYVWRSAATNADDGVNWIKPNDTAVGSAGRWKKEG